MSTVPVFPSSTNVSFKEQDKIRELLAFIEGMQAAGEDSDAVEKIREKAQKLENSSEPVYNPLPWQQYKQNWENWEIRSNDLTSTSTTT